VLNIASAPPKRSVKLGGQESSKPGWRSSCPFIPETPDADGILESQSERMFTYDVPPYFACVFSRHRSPPSHN
jgi:hypothetical protein